MAFKTIKVGKKGATCLILLNRPSALNAINPDMLIELRAAINEASADRRCRSVVIGSTGKAFCAGADIKYIAGLKSAGDARSFVDLVHSVLNQVSALDMPVIAAVDGYCLGGGCELALACDIRIATKRSRFGQPEVKLGIVPGGGATYRLPAAVGLAAAKEMIFTGSIIDAKEAFRIGLVNRVVANGKVVPEAERLAAAMNSNSYSAIKNAKHAISKSAAANGAAERDAFVAAFNSADRKEGLRAFIRHRKPRFSLQGGRRGGS